MPGKVQVQDIWTRAGQSLQGKSREIPQCGRPFGGSSMSRGPRSKKAFEAAIPVARMRGEVMFFERWPGSCFDLMACGPAGPGAIRSERALRIHGSPAQIAADHAGTIDRMNAAALPPGISRELWLWSPWGTMRYFRIESTAITELDMLGNVRSPLVKGALAAKKRPRRGKDRKKTKRPVPAPGAGPEQQPETGNLQPADAAVPGTVGMPQPPTTSPSPPAPAGTGGREPAPARYLRKRNAELRQEKDGGRRAPTDGTSPVTPGDGIPPS